MTTAKLSRHVIWAIAVLLVSSSAFAGTLYPTVGSSGRWITQRVGEDSKIQAVVERTGPSWEIWSGPTWDPTASTAYHAGVDWGYLHDYAIVSRPDTIGEWYILTASAQSFFIDSLSFSPVDPRVGGSGFAALELTVDGDLSPSGSHEALVLVKDLGCQTCGMTPLTVMQRFVRTSGSATYLTGLFPVAFGEQVFFRVSLTVTADLSGNGPGESWADFEHTLRLSGVRLFDAQSNPITDFTMSSGSGTAYPVPEIPEPASILLLGTGVAGLCARRRARR